MIDEIHLAIIQLRFLPGFGRADEFSVLVFGFLDLRSAAVDLVT
jgi:hypothetical protein